MSNDVAELKQYIAAHAESLGIPAEHYRAVFARVEHDGSGPGSWVYEWSAAGNTVRVNGDPLRASQYYNFARFPFADGAARKLALVECVRSLDEWRQGIPGIEYLDLELPGGRVGLWASGLSESEPRPLLLISGGIVSLKEQWAPVLLAARELGLAAVVTEMPGVGENTLRYTPDSWRMLPAVVDALGSTVDSARTSVMAMSFSGQAALRWALSDSRVRGIVTAGAPINGVFTDTAWQRKLPKVTVDTLAHMAETDASGLSTVLPGWALSAAELRRLAVPLYYVASTRDEIIPQSDIALLRDNVPELHLLAHDDVHGAPNHAAETRQWMIQAIVQLNSEPVAG